MKIKTNTLTGATLDVSLLPLAVCLNILRWIGKKTGNY